MDKREESEYPDKGGEVAAGSEDNSAIGSPRRVIELSNMVSGFLNHAINRKNCSLLELRLVAATFKALADNWEESPKQVD